ncbi:MAG TPA: hypothetical protein VK661_00505 [Planctomycetota bacterium]|nr:hypothetical protein [Planctomycetota bacterium]
MPVIFVSDTQRRAVARVRRMIRGVNQAVSETLEVPPNTVWVRYDPGAPELYGEGTAGRVPKEGRPVFVFVRMTEGRDAKRLQGLYRAISGAVAKAFDMFPDFVWTRIEEFPPDRVGQGAQSYAEIRKQKKR